MKVFFAIKLIPYDGLMSGSTEAASLHCILTHRPLSHGHALVSTRICTGVGPNTDDMYFHYIFSLRRFHSWSWVTNTEAKY